MKKATIWYANYTDRAIKHTTVNADELHIALNDLDFIATIILVEYHY